MVPFFIHKIFTKISLPLARPSIALGVTLATLDALADYGTVEFLGVPTFTTGIFRVWFGMEDTISAAQMASVFLTILFVIIIFEKNGCKTLVGGYDELTSFIANREEYIDNSTPIKDNKKEPT